VARGPILCHIRLGQFDLSDGNLMEEIMAWTAPVAVEVCVGMEITSYASAEI
jgi:coenzyme PQQ precursor peptide PqqA